MALGERECSIQRRHQKVLEEAPVALDPELRAEMSAAAVRFAERIGYRNAGTAEFMLAGGDFYFLELNGRIQVEHPVTELVTGVDLVARAAPDRRAASRSRPGNTLLQGHAVEVRLYAEDPRTFLPQAGRLERLRLPDRDPGRRGGRGGRRGRRRLRPDDREADRPRADAGRGVRRGCATRSPRPRSPA